MAYEIVMPQLSDSMEEGTLVSWKVKAGDRVEQGDVIAEVESDKAILEVQSFKAGKVEGLMLKEGESAAVGTVIANIAVDTKAGAKKPEAKEKEAMYTPEKHLNASESVTLVPNNTRLKPSSHDFAGIAAEEKTMLFGTASPKAKALAAYYGLDIERLQADGKLSTPAHTNDIKKYYESRYFTAKALKVLSKYDLSTHLFEKGKKYSEADIVDYVKKNTILLPEKLNSMQKNIIAAVTASAQKPVYHIYDSIESHLLKEHADDEYTLTFWLIKLFAEAIMQYEVFRTTLRGRSMQIWPNASLAVAMANERALYMPVFHACNTMSSETLRETLKRYKSFVKEGRMLPELMQGSTFGISNLGMLGIERFDALINGNDCGMVAIGAEREGKISITLTLDHRIINGWQGAEFMQTLKALAKNPLFFKESE